VSHLRIHFKNISSLLLSGAASKILVFLATIKIIKALSVPDNGIYQVAYSLGFIYSLFAELGIRGYLFRELSRVHDQPEARQFIFSDVWNLRVLLSALVLPVSVIVSCALGYRQDVVLYTFFLTLYALLDTFAILLKFTFRAFERMELDPLFTVLGRGILLGSVLVLAHTRNLNIRTLVITHVTSAVVEICAITITMKWLLPLRFFLWHSASGVKAVLRASIPFAVVNLVGFLYLKTGLVLVSILINESASAFFGTAGRVPEAATFFPIALANAFIPFFSRNAQDVPAIRRYFEILLKYSGFAGAAFAAFFLFDTRFIILLFAKKEYLVAISTFQLYGVWTFITFLQVIIANLLICLNEEKQLMWRYVISLILNIVLNFILIPRYGISGAGIALVSTEVFARVYNLFLLHSRQVKVPLYLIIETGTVFCAVSAALLLMAPFGDWIRCSGAVVVGIMLVMVFSARRDWRILRQARASSQSAIRQFPSE
jgi:O-antigen/teichoic acid export membrane protein